MTKAEQIDVINDFLEWLGSRELSVCNYSKNGAGFWPIGEPDRLAQSFVNR